VTRLQWGLETSFSAPACTAAVSRPWRAAAAVAEAGARTAAADLAATISFEAARMDIAGYSTGAGVPGGGGGGGGGESERSDQPGAVHALTYHVVAFLTRRGGAER
jgi:hypothetical protein